MSTCVCVCLVQRLADHQSSSADDNDEFLGYLYFSAASPLGAHGNPPSRVMFVEMHMKHSGASLYCLAAVMSVCLYVCLLAE